MRTLFIILFTPFFSCKQSDLKTNSQVLDFKAFTIEVPSTWKKVKDQGIDSYVGSIAIDSVDTVRFDLGVWSNSLTEDQPVLWKRSEVQNLPNFDTTQFILVDSPLREDPDMFRKQALTWDTIDGREAKIVFPRRSGKGLTGIYIDSLWMSRGDVDRFNFLGIDLNPVNEREFLKAIKTIKFQNQN